jgi:hypothetical protein
MDLLLIEKTPFLVQFLDAIVAAFQPSIANDALTLTKQHYAHLKSTG